MERKTVMKSTLLLFHVLCFGPLVISSNYYHGQDGGGSRGVGDTGEFRFTQSFYNASVPENSRGSTMVVPLEKMGVWNENPSRRIHYSIISGDPQKMFRAEPLQIGDFCFLIIKVNENDRILNREFKELYKVQVKAVVHADIQVDDGRTIERKKFKRLNDTGGSVWTGDKSSSAWMLRELKKQKNGGGDHFVTRAGDSSPSAFSKFAQVGSSGGDDSLKQHTTTTTQTSLEGLEHDPKIRDNDIDVDGASGGDVSGGTIGSGGALEGGDVGKDKEDIGGGGGDSTDRGTSSKSSSIIISETTSFRSKDILRTAEEEEAAAAEQETTTWSSSSNRRTDEFDGKRSSSSGNSNGGNSVSSGDFVTSRTRSSSSDDGDDYEEDDVETTTLNLELSQQQAPDGSRRRKKSKRDDTSAMSRLADQKDGNVASGGSSDGGGDSKNKHKGSKKSLRRNLRDERRPRARIKNRSGERRKGRKDKDRNSVPDAVAGADKVYVVKTTAAPATTPEPGKRTILEATTIVYIRIIDLDDNNPIHEYSSYDVAVNEDAPVLSKVTKISAADADIGRNQEIYYSLADWSNSWSIDPITGVLAPIRPLDSRSERKQIVRVLAKNRWSSGPGSAGSIATVNVNIRPVNRYEPVIRITRPPQVEARPYGVIYAVVTVRDGDEGENGVASIEIKGGDPNGIFRVRPTSIRNEFYIEMSPIVAKSFDLKGHRSQNFNLTLKATDHGVPGKSSEKEFQVKVMDDLWSDKLSNSGIFDQDVYQVEIPETAPPHTVVFRFKRPGSKVTLSISSGNEGDDFYLEEKSGVLYTSRWLDADEGKSSYTLTIDSRVKRSGRMDSSSPRIRQSVAKIIVKIKDCNDHDPRLRISFPNNSSEVIILENEPAGTKVAKITARDADQGENGYVTYNIANLKPTPFTIDHFTGEVRTTKPLDYETSRRKYKLKIRASDWGQPSRRESEITITVMLKNVNDNRPVNTLTNCISVIDRNIKFDTEFGQVQAIDFDRGDVVIYRIAGGNEDSCFSVDQYSGKLKVMCDLRDLRATRRYLNVTASDGEYYSDMMTIKMDLTDGLRTNFNKSETLRSGVKLFSTAQSAFECQDTGVGERHDRLVALSEGNNRLDEADLIEDGFAPLPSRYGENIHEPQFVDLPNEISVNESTAVGSVVLALKARDMDKGYNGLLSFVISGGDEIHGAWDVVNDERITVPGGVVQEASLVLALPLDREEIASYVLNISVWDQGKPAKSAWKLLTVKVMDTNDNAPQFVKPAIKIKFAEGDQLVGEALVQVAATDADEAGTPNAEISYRLLTDYPEFSIEEKTGIVRLMTGLDRERQQSYELLVMAEDRGTPKKLSSISLLTILVEDRNDNAPKFDFESHGGSKYKIARVPGDWPVGAVVTRVFAKDQDLGLAGSVRYSLVDGDKGDFSIDEISGVLRVQRDLNYDITSIYNLTIRARDMGTPSLESESFVIVEVVDVRKSGEMFSFGEIVMRAEIGEDVPVGSIVTRVTPESFTESKYPGLVFTLEGATRFLFSIDNAGVLRTAHGLNHEEKAHHWLAVLARNVISGDNFARLEVFINVTDVNECVPLTQDPIYHVQIPENSLPGTSVLQVQAFDCDTKDEFKFSLKSSTPYFDIHPETGEIFTTDSNLDREKTAEHSLDIVVQDTGSPSLSSITKVVIKIKDENDMSPMFLNRGGRHTIPELGSDLQRDGPPEEEDEENAVEDDDDEETLKWSEWTAMDIEDGMVQNAEGWKKIYRVVAWDGDAGQNGSVSYRLKYRVSTGSGANAGARDDEVFSIHPRTGEIYTSAAVIKSDTVLKFLVEAKDGGLPAPMATELELVLKVVGINKKASKPPTISVSTDQTVSLTTKEKPGYTVEHIDATDPDGDPLWFEIVAGDPEQYFLLLPDSRDLILARPMLTEQEFKLNISVSDGQNNVFTQLTIRVIESGRVSSFIWEKRSYVTHIHESGYDFTPIARVRVNSSLSTNWSSSSTPILYGFHNAQDLRTLGLFSIDSLTGDVSIAKPNEIDRETLAQHIITIKARDPLQYYSFVRLVVNVIDRNDMSPIFPAGIYGGLMRAEIRIPETTPVGTPITQIEAFDMDEGENGRLTYSITFGNTGNTFHMDRDTGWLYLNRALALPAGESSLEFGLTVKASDNGEPNALSATTPVNVIVTLASDDRVLALQCDDESVTNTRGYSRDSWVHVRENAIPGTYVTTARVHNSMTVSYEIEENRDNLFWIDPTTGVILVGKHRGKLDRERKSSHELLIKATNMRGLSASCKIHVVVEDENDNAPSFTVIQYQGQISEGAPLGTLVMEKVAGRGSQEAQPLVLHTTDADAGKNARVTYSIIEDEEMRTVFHIDPTTGALLLVTPLDYEKRTHYTFHVRAIDDGGLVSSNIALVNVSVLNVNDQPPSVKSARVELFLPTVKGLLVHTVEGTDADGDSVFYNISRGNVQGYFEINGTNGEIRIAKVESFAGAKHVLEVSVTDGRFTSVATINIHVKNLETNAGFMFRNSTFYGSAFENSTKVSNLLSLSVVGAEINENLRFAILNPTPYFGVMQTSGVIYTLGVKLDREQEPRHNLLVQVRGDGPDRIARAYVEISVIDINDNAPNFLHLPYVAVMPVDAQPGDRVLQVKAFDADEGENSIVRFELVRSPYGDIYELNKYTGEIRLRRKPDGVGHHEITIKAYDGGLPTMTSETLVQIKIVTHDQPVFEQQYYETWIPEDAALQSTALALQAHAKNAIMYSIEEGNEFEQFGIDYQTGVLYVNSPLDYESQPMHRLTVKATDLVTSSWSTTVVSVRIRDSNDIRPKFERPVYTIRLTEGHMPENGVVGIVKAHDNDTGLNGILTYEIVSDDSLRVGAKRILRDLEGGENEEEDGDQGQDGDQAPQSHHGSLRAMMSEDATSNNYSLDPTKWFSIRANDGTIVLKQPLDYERFHSLRFSVVAKDSGIPSLSSTARVLVEVVGINDNGPIFEKNVYNAKVSEDAARGHVVAKVTAYDPDEMDTLRYAIVGYYRDKNAFDIDEKSGVVTVSQPKVLLTELSFTLNISVTDGVFTSFTRLHVEVEPRNHESPSFSSLIYEVGCPENSPDGYLIATLTAIDPDRSVFGKVRYFIADTDEPGLFLLNEETGQVRLSSTPEVSLDREYKESHTLEIGAEDGGGWLGFTKLAVKVGNVNEHQPIFVVEEYRVTLPAERLSSKNPILQVLAIDADTEFGIRYSIVDLADRVGNSSVKRDSSYFDMSPETGEIRFKMNQADVAKFSLDRIDFQFWAVATDEGGLHSHVPVTIVVLPDGHPTPEIQPQNATFFVKEDAPVGSMVTTFVVTNIQSPRFRVVSSNDEFFRVDDSGNLLINARLDQEQEDKHTVVIWAESGDGMSVATSQVTIRVLDSNDNPPMFNAGEYSVKVAEDFPEGSLIFTVHAVDADKSRNVKQRYSLVPSGSGSEMSHFSVNQEHGWITLANKLDYETNSMHTLHVVATDSEKPHLMSTATVIVQVLNVNDNQHSFDSSRYYASVREDVAEGSHVATVHTTDLDDVRRNGTTITPSILSYYILAGNEKGHFKINERGEISVWRCLDAEVDQQFELRILATDGVFSDYANVSISIIDVNDNTPVCPVAEYETLLLESVPTRTYVTTMEAHDPDISGLNPAFYLSGKGAQDFKIDPESGVVTTYGKLDREGKEANYALTVHAVDKETGYECNSLLRVAIEDVNDNKPKFTEDRYTVSVKEDAPIGALVGKVHADDADVGMNRRVRYALIATVAAPNTVVENQFGLDTNTGVLSLLRPLDRELISHYNLTVQATDGGSPALVNTVLMSVIVSDVNDNPPEFFSTYYSAEISERAPVTTEVTRVMATSKDINENAEITYKIVGGNGYSHFGIDPKTGLIFVNSSLDYEKVREYVLAVKAQDGGQPPLAAQCLVNITVKDYNDNPPVFSGTFSVQVSEDAPISMSVIQLLANDPDSGNNAVIRYDIIGGDRFKHFSIDPTSGVVSVNGTLDREKIPQYTLEIRAADQGVPPLQSTTTLEVEVSDVNDNAPQFVTDLDNFTAVVQEDRPLGYVVQTFAVSDADAPPNTAPFNWDLRDLEAPADPPLPFTISETGALTVAGKLNFQRKNFYKLQVRVFDNGDPPLFTDANITVKVVDKSQWPPVVSALSVTAITADESYPAGIALGKVHASDFDPYDTLVYSLLETPSSSIFTIDSLNGTLRPIIPLREGAYQLAIGVSDGRWTARGEAYVKIISLATLLPDARQGEPPFGLPSPPPPAFPSGTATIKPKGSGKTSKDLSSFAVVMTLTGHKPQSVITRIFGFISVVKEAMGSDGSGGGGMSSYDVFILSIQSTNQTKPSVRDKRDALAAQAVTSDSLATSALPAVDILLAVRKTSDGNWVLPVELVKKLRFAIPRIESVLQGRVARLEYDVCDKKSCDRGKCRTMATFDGTQSLISTESVSIITPNHQLETMCICPPGYGGARCEKVINACAYSECSSGYICVPDSSTKGYACLCQKTYCSPDGNCEDQCAQQSVSFSGTSFLAYNVGPSLERELSISVLIKTLYTSGTLLHTYGQFDYALLEIKQGLVQFSWDLGTGKEVLTVTSTSVSDNRWHQILLQIKDNYAILSVDTRSTQRQKSPGPARSLHTGGVIYIGARIIGIPGATLDNVIPAQGFIGCMKDLRYGYVSPENSSQLKNPSEMYIQEVKHLISPAVNRLSPEIAIPPEYDDEDDGQPLPGNDPTIAKMPRLPLHSAEKNSGGAQLMWSRNISFSCERLFHVVEACRSQPCLNGGTCVQDRTTNGYRCDCPSRFHGLNCEIDLDPCSSQPCLNGGRCTPTTTTSISFSPSLAGGDPQEPQYYCHCLEGTYGYRCERGRWCKNSADLYGGESEVCNRRGDCEDGPTGPICWCEKGYTGSACQLDINECERGDACGPGSTCVNYMGGFRCLCPANATGTRCLRVLATPSIIASDYHELLFIVVGVIMLLMILIIFIFVRRCCIARERNGAGNAIPLTAHIKDKDNRGRDNRDQIMRNRDSKISNLDVRPVSATSDLFATEMRSPLDPIKSYGSAGDDLEKPSFINNLMKGSGSGDKKRGPGHSGWDTNRDDYAKVQNYIKDEINWASKGTSKPSSPVSSVAASSGYHWDHSDLTQPANISPARGLVPPEVPDSLSVISHDSNNTEMPAINLASLPPIDSARDMDTLIEEEASAFTNKKRPDEGTCIDDAVWPVPHADQYLLPHRMSEGTDTTDQDEPVKPIALNNRYRGKNLNFPTIKLSTNGEVSDDEANENSQLLAPPPEPMPLVIPTTSTMTKLGPHETATIRARNVYSSNGNPSYHHNKHGFIPIPTVSPAGSTASSNGPAINGTVKKKPGKTTHITQV